MGSRQIINCSLYAHVKMRQYRKESRLYDEWAREIGAPVPSDKEKLQELRETRKTIQYNTF